MAFKASLIFFFLPLGVSETCCKHNNDNNQNNKLKDAKNAAEGNCRVG